MTTEITWEQAVLQVLGGATEPMHYGDIAEAILRDGLKTSTGKTPNYTVAGVISRMRKDGVGNIAKIKPGVFQIAPEPVSATSEEYDELDAVDAIENLSVAAYGLHWERDKVDWKTNSLLGYDATYDAVDPDPERFIDFADQQGVYLLHSWQSVVYVGKTTAKEGGLLQRLRNHHRRQLWSAKWERFSWFGLRQVDRSGGMIDGPASASKEIVSALLESVLIETLRPTFNQQQGNYMGTLYRQAIDPGIARARAEATLRHLVTR